MDWTTGLIIITLFKIFIVESSRYTGPPATRFQGTEGNLRYSMQYGPRGPPVTLLPVKSTSRFNNYCSLYTLQYLLYTASRYTNSKLGDIVQPYGYLHLKVKLLGSKSNKFNQLFCACTSIHVFLLW